ncbi:MAG: stage II sporulation protein M, partial [Verrucomicrobiota bacterium]
DVLTLVLGAAIMLVFAGIIESFLSQYHGPAIYPWKIGFGCVLLGSLIWYLGFSGRAQSDDE